MQKLCVFSFFLILSNSVAIAATNDIRVTIADNPWINATFVRKEKTKREGWLIYLRITNKTNKPIVGLSTSFDMGEDQWIVDSDHVFVGSSGGLLQPKENLVFGWIRKVPSSINRIHIYQVEPQFRTNAAPLNRSAPVTPKN